VASTEDDVSAFVAQAERTGIFKRKAIRAALLTQLAMVEEKIFKDLERAATEEASPARSRETEVWREAQRLTKDALERLDRDRTERESWFIGAAGVAVAIGALLVALFSLWLQKAGNDLARGTAYADEPMTIVVRPGKGAEIVVENLSAFTVRHIEVSTGVLEYSTACDTMRVGAGSLQVLVGGGDADASPYPEVYWEELRPFEKRPHLASQTSLAGSTTVGPGARCDPGGANGIHVGGGFIPQRPPSTAAVPACSSTEPCRNMVFVVVRARHPYTSAVRTFHEVLVADPSGNLAASNAFFKKDGTGFRWTSEADRKMFVRFAQWRAHQLTYRLREEQLSVAFSGQGLWKATGVQAPAGLTE
jgi:hypothetical protein